MIDLPLIEPDQRIDLHPRIYIYNQLLLILNLLSIIGIFFSIIWVNKESLPSNVSLLLMIISLVTIVLLIIDIYSYVLIAKSTRHSIDSVNQVYLLPVILDIVLIFALGIGIIRIFLRIVVYGALNPDTKYYDESDPLFS